MLSFNEFCDYMKENLPKYIDDITKDNIDISDTVKNNGVILKSLRINSPLYPECANLLHMKYFYEEYERGKNIDELTAAIAMAYKEAREGYNERNIDIEILSKPDINYIVPRLVNYEKNKEMLSNCPYILFQDMAITFRVVCFKDNKDVMSTIVNNVMFERLDMSTEELYEISLKNYERIFPPVTRKLGEIIREMGYDMPDPSMENMMYVVTNDSGINGATSILLDVVRDNLAEVFENDYYLIPSSVHELIAIEVTEEMEPEIVIGFIKDVNKTTVSNQDYLSDTLYHYDVKKMKISMVNPPESMRKEVFIEMDKKLDKNKEDEIRNEMTKEAR